MPANLVANLCFMELVQEPVGNGLVGGVAELPVECSVFGMGLLDPLPAFAGRAQLPGGLMMLPMAPIVPTITMPPTAILPMSIMPLVSSSRGWCRGWRVSW